MTKTNNKTKLILFVIVIASLFASIVGTWTVYGKDIEGNTDAVVELKEEGCKPAQEHKTSIALVEKDISTIQKDVSAIQADTKEILKQLRK
ncbi:unnamed protein product [marine sediment metagenome]|uniref:Uncharacterized protein n=1 Tax=marine sediment metagenome TaxID=412755 RepID=X1B2Q1_9ZZZZ